jgi:pimeloyl-ACP methyl ester carboxylesterase
VRTDPARARGLARIACPTAIVWGRHDPFLPAVTPHELAARIPGATLTLIEARHFVVEERPREVLAALEHLLARPAGNTVGVA